MFCYFIDSHSDDQYDDDENDGILDAQNVDNGCKSGEI